MNYDYVYELWSVNIIMCCECNYGCGVKVSSSEVETTVNDVLHVDSG